MNQKDKGENTDYFGKGRIFGYDESPFHFSLGGPKWPYDFTQEMKRGLLTLTLTRMDSQVGNFRWKQPRFQRKLKIYTGHVSFSGMVLKSRVRETAMTDPYALAGGTHDGYCSNKVAIGIR
jgi:hypothetical protein